MRKLMHRYIKELVESPQPSNKARIPAQALQGRALVQRLSIGICYYQI